MAERQGIPPKLAAGRATPLGRPTKARAAAIPDAILAAAFEAFSDSGYDAATMEGIAERAGVSKGTLYGRYPDKSALFRAMLQSRVKRWAAVRGADDDRLPTDLAPLLQHHARTVERTLAWPELSRIRRMIYAMDARSFPEIAAFWEEFGTERFVRLLADDMAVAAGEGGREQPDWLFLARTFLFTFSGWYQSNAVHRPVDPAEVTRFINQLVGAIVALATAEELRQVSVSCSSPP